MAFIKQTTHIVDVIKYSNFDDNDIKSYLELVPDGRNGMATAFPELYGEDLPPALSYFGPELIDIAELQPGPFGYVQTYRVGGKSRKFDKIRRGIGRNGFKLKYPAIAVFRAPNGDLHIITGYTQVPYGGIVCSPKQTNLLKLCAIDG
mgnify:CR=1 FL=1